jgi:amino acid transporter
MLMTWLCCCPAGTLVGMFAVSRIIAAVARTHLLPPFLAKVHARFGTPWIATLLQGIATAMIALFTGGCCLRQLQAVCLCLDSLQLCSSQRGLQTGGLR